MTRGEGGDGPRRSAKWHDRRKVIIDTSAAVFARQGYHATGLAELCTANELGRGALYHYIGSKEQLLLAIHDRVMDEVMLSVERTKRAGGTASEQLTMLGDELIDIIATYPDHVWVSLHEFSGLSGEHELHYRRRRQEYERSVEAILQAGIDSGEFRDVDARLTSLAWLGMHNYTYRWMKSSDARPAHEVATAFADIFVRGITGTGTRLPRRRQGAE
jgi:AcrR family transcriptional regulator